MRITGWCLKCHKIRTVRITHMRTRAHPQMGICAACEAKEDREAEERRLRRLR